MDKRNISQQTAILNQISKVSDAIRQKHKLLKTGKDAAEQAANEVFKPIVTPLRALVENSKVSKYVIQRGKEKEKEKEEKDTQNYALKMPEISDYKLQKGKGNRKRI